MEFRLDDVQLALQDTVGRFCAARFPLDRVAGREGRPTDRIAWKELAALGVFGLLVPEAHGGDGLGAVEAAVVFEQLGSHLVSGPALWSVLAAPLVPGATAGDVLVGGIDVTTPAADGALGPLVVEHAGELDALVVLRPAGVFLVAGDALPRPEELTPLDPLTPVGSFATLPFGDQVGGVEAAADLRQVGTVLAAALLLGIAARALEVARSYALEREQFGVPIGSFQAVKHILADMYVRTGLSRSATYAAAAVVDDPGIGDPARTASAAKLLAGEAAVDNAAAAVQVLGGMGFTWAMPPHHLLKRAWVLEHAFDTADDHALALGSALGHDARADQ
jgi:alkylation response protein AidB-like acyl-CoA dehydrogenase